MFCPNCGTKLEDSAVFCSSCGARLDHSQNENAVPEASISEPSAPWQETPAQSASPDPWQQPEAKAAGPVAPPDYLTVNIVLTVVSVFACCFSCLGFVALITGIIGIVSASQVRSAMQAQNYALAEQKSRTAKSMWITTAILLGVSLLMGVLLFATGFMEEFLYLFMDSYY